MAVRVFVILLAFALASTAVCLDCYRCIRERQQQGGAEKFCNIPSPPSQLGNNTVENCTTEQCAIVKIVDKDGLVTDFRRQCGTTNDTCVDTGCKSGQGGAIRCISCCKTNLCNDDSATGTTPVPTSGTQARYTSLLLIIFVVLFAVALSLIQ